jgi:membrane protein implicated in regulation of membrane protease activity
MKVIKAVYNFLVGDMIILVGVLITIILLALINAVSVLAPLRTVSGVILVIAVLVVLTATLSREARGKR